MFRYLPEMTLAFYMVYMHIVITHSERRPQNIYSQEELNLYCIIKLATGISLCSLQIINLMFCIYIDTIKYEHLAILSNLKSCQFAPRIVIFNLFLCCQFEDLQIISPKINWQMRAHFLQKIFSFSTQFRICRKPNQEF